MKEKQKAAERENFNAKYAAQNQKIAKELKAQRLAAENKAKKRTPSNDNSSSSAVETSSPQSPSKPSPSQKQKLDQDPQTDVLISGIEYKELISYMQSSSMKLSNPCLRKRVYEYVVKKIEDSGHQLSSADHDEIFQKATKFFNTFTKKYNERKVNRHLSRLLEDTWCANRLSVTLEGSKSDSPPPETGEKSSFQAGTFTQAELAEVMKRNNQFSFTDTANQKNVLKEYILSNLNIQDLDAD